MLMHKPLHPGEILRGLCLEPLDLSVTDAAIDLWRAEKLRKSLRVTRLAA